MRLLKRLVLSLFILFLLISSGIYWYASRQGRDSVDWSRYPGVAFDADGVPTIAAVDWIKAVETQGFVVASDRLWQMDLMRRSAEGTLSEWFGEKAVSWDQKRRAEDWAAVADRAVKDFPAGERVACEAYADGVNRFIQERPRYWSAEYVLLGEKPKPWACRDSVLILLSMVEDLTESFEAEAQASVWRKALPPSWEGFLFPQDHPWNRPLFVKAPGKPRQILPTVSIKKKALDPTEVQEPAFLSSFFPGSNAWVYRGADGVFVANDPHLSYGVPQLWYPLRLKISPDEWAVGVAIPGMPGIVLGRNAHVAWGFTNVGEDVDDLLEEEVSKDGRRYVAQVSGGKKQWKAVEERPYTIHVRAAKDVTGTARFTQRGPLSERAHLGKKLYSRTWLGFQRGVLRLPTVDMMSCRNWEEFNRAADAFLAPAQAIVFAQDDGAIGLRVSGVGIRRSRSGLVPLPAAQGEWLGLESVAERPRLFFPAGEPARFISTANQRLWIRGWGEHWGSDHRQDRIQTLFENAESVSMKDMQRFQLDTHSRFHQLLLHWIADHAEAQNERQAEWLKRYRGWNGVLQTDETAFAHAYYAEGLITALALGRVRKAYLPAKAAEVDYDWKMHQAWQLALLGENVAGRDPWKVFGLNSKEVAQWVLGRLDRESGRLKGYSKANAWRSQHPFVRGVPGLGRFFSVDAHPQVGFDGVVRVERPFSGASTRLVWDLKNPAGSQWAFPVGQSGHFLSSQFENFRRRWFADQYAPVVAD